MSPPMENPSSPSAKRVRLSSHRTWPSVTISIPAAICSSMTSRTSWSCATWTSASVASPRSRAWSVFRRRKSPPSWGGFGYEPTTVMVGLGIGAGCYSRVSITSRGRRICAGDPLLERVAAGAGALGGRVVDGEASCFEAVDEVDLRLLQVGSAHLIDGNPDPEVLVGDVPVADVVVQIHGITKARTASGLHGHPKHDIWLPLLCQELLHLAGR